MNNGNVVRFLETVPNTECVPLVSNICKYCLRGKAHYKLQMLDIAEGLNYLHTFKPSIIHGDIKGVSRTHLIEFI